MFYHLGLEIENYEINKTDHVMQIEHVFLTSLFMIFVMLIMSIFYCACFRRKGYILKDAQEKTEFEPKQYYGKKISSAILLSY